MNQEIKEKWLEALRSGKYKQGFTRLKQNNRYCCLGVLCSLLPGDWQRVTGETYKFHYMYNHESQGYVGYVNLPDIII